jgi:hypothetical protein
MTEDRYHEKVEQAPEAAAERVDAHAQRGIARNLFTRLIDLCPYSPPLEAAGGRLWQIMNASGEMVFASTDHADCMARYHGMVARWYRKQGAPPLMEVTL